MHHSTQHDDEINLLDVLKYCRKYYKVLIITAFLGLVAGVVISIVSFLEGEMSKQYVIKSSIAVTSQYENGNFTSKEKDPNSTDVHLAEDMADSVIYIVQSDKILEKVIDELQLIGVTTKAIYDNMVCTQFRDTQIVDIELYWRNAEEGIKILNTIDKFLPDVLREVAHVGDVHVINSPTSKYLIGGSINAGLWLLMIALGLAAGVVIIIVLMSTSPTLIKASDAEEQIGLPVLGNVPQDPYLLSAAGSGASMKEILENCRHDTIDSYLSIAQILKKSIDKVQAKTLLFTSTERREGTTQTIAGIASQLAGLEKKVLVVDLALHSPSLGKKFSKTLPMEQSLNAVYQGDASISEAVLHISGYLHVLPLIHDKNEIVYNDTILKLLQETAKDYDYVLLDSTAVNVSAETLRLSEFTDGAVYIVKQDQACLKDIKTGIEKLQKMDVRIFGDIINQVR